jgi:hypothetical protein
MFGFKPPSGTHCKIRRPFRADARHTDGAGRRERRREAALAKPGRTEREIEEEIYALALRQFGVEKQWRKADRPHRQQHALELFGECGATGALPNSRDTILISLSA